MNLSIIKSFIADQRTAKKLLHEKLGIKPNTKAADWAASYSEIMRRYEAGPFARIFNPHGCGVELSVRDLYIDFDYSREGRADGFDAWRLYVYIMAGDYDNGETDKHFSTRVRKWVESLASEGRIERLDNLYYLTR